MRATERVAFVLESTGLGFLVVLKIPNKALPHPGVFAGGGVDR